MAGYSGTALPKKLGIKEGSRLALLSEPKGFRAELEPLPDSVEILDSLEEDQHDVDTIVLFGHDLASLQECLPRVVRRLAENGGLWIAWPKKTSGVDSDLTFSEVQREGLETGLVDNKVCAVSDVYSGLRFVVRKEHRREWSRGHRQSG